jgi:hypothetical protein
LRPQEEEKKEEGGDRQEIERVEDDIEESREEDEPLETGDMG